MAGLYIHIPFCAQKCAYCDFVSFAGRDCEEEYITAVLSEMKAYPQQDIDTVFIGGGTPSYISEDNIARLLNEAGAHFYLKRDAEITLECNPSSLSRQKLQVYKSAGVNRLSIGLQSSLDEELKLLGRLHDYNRFVQAYEWSRREFSNINIDLISSLPGQTWEDFELTLEKAVAVSPEHISVYSLIIDEHTPLGIKVDKGELKPISEEEDRRIYHKTGGFLEKAGYARYEISNYALSGRECRHNLNYWLGGDYIGLGCAAHSCYDNKRYHNACDLNGYLHNPHARYEVQELNREDRLLECIMLELRLISGIDRSRFKARFGRDIYELYTQRIDMLVQNGLLQLTPQALRLTDKGLDLADWAVLQLIS